MKFGESHKSEKTFHKNLLPRQAIMYYQKSNPEEGSKANQQAHHQNLNLSKQRKPKLSHQLKSRTPVDDYQFAPFKKNVMKEFHLKTGWKNVSKKFYFSSSSNSLRSSLKSSNKVHSKTPDNNFRAKLSSIPVIKLLEEKRNAFKTKWQENIKAIKQKQESIQMKKKTLEIEKHLFLQTIRNLELHQAYQLKRKEQNFKFKKPSSISTSEEERFGEYGFGQY